MCPAEEPVANDELGEPPLVMVVEDEVLIRIATADALRDCGFVVVEAASGEEAQALILSGLRPNLIFSDINMPGSLDGVGLVQWVREWGLDTPIVLTSGQNDALEAARGACASVEHFMAKPYEHKDVVARFRALLAR